MSVPFIGISRRVYHQYPISCRTFSDSDLRAHKALVILGNLLDESSWQSALRPLNHQDIHSMSNLLWGESEGRWKLSWIWNMRGTGGSEKDNNGALEDMRIEWCKARACAMRWEEEVELLREEMCRIGAFLRWEAGRWDARRDEAMPADMEHEDRMGLGNICRGDAFKRRWECAAPGDASEKWQEYAALGNVPENGGDASA
ncbi:hypothetical protein DFJ58DRAFT_845206 [Suillus subalutaceus]|uniref:uncharacterized protein n=1 Tax=Suillus subalutaceus TaxID=48586 RepID=UPI001B877DC7|nr:uncharacterized protein DFJ58DRAFT_845206 [Suillus subalutaceus]KAG1840936.1 hypothetical protein DFJ58DRAFT_845206 [Suillus subalutaceus]